MDYRLSTQKTLDFLKQQLQGIDFAVTGSYAESVLSSSNRFNNKSDLDVIVSECDIEETAEKLLNFPNYTSIHRVYDYGPGPCGPTPSPNPLPKPGEGSKPIKKYDSQFSEYILKGKLTSIHLIGSYRTNKETLEVDGIKYVAPVSQELLSLAA